MQEQSKKAHLNGKRHAAQAQQDRNTIASADYKQIYTDNKAKRRSPRIITNSTEKAKVDAALPASHTVSLVQGSPTTSEINTYAVQNTDELPEYMAVSSVSNDILWKCTLCNLCMAPALGPAHLICEAHIRRLVCSLRIPGPTVRQDQDRRGLQGIECKPEALQASDVILHSQVSTFLIVQQSSGAGPLISVYETKALGALDLLFDNTSKPKPTACLWTYPHSSTEFDIHQTYVHRYPVSKPSIPSIADNPLDQFFESFSKFPYNACIPPATSYKNLRANLWKWHDWDGHRPSTWREYRQEVQARYEVALTDEFNLWFGTEDDLKSWHSLCRALGIIPLPLTCEECRSVSSCNQAVHVYIHKEHHVSRLIRCWDILQVIKGVHVNIVDLIQWARRGERGAVQTFNTIKELSSYSYGQNKIYKKDQLRPGVVLRYLLRELSAARQRV